METTKSRLSTLWTFATLNYLYCDVTGLMDPKLLKQFLAGNVGGIDVSQGFLLAAGALVEIPIAMCLDVADPPEPREPLGKHHRRRGAFFSVIEIGATSVIVWYAWKWATGVVTASAKTSLVPAASAGQ